jgi:hypothetical protein
MRTPLWSSGQSSWLQIQRSGFDSQHYQIFWQVVGLERCPLSLVSTIEELLGRRWLLGRYSLLTNSGHGGFVYTFRTLCDISIVEQFLCAQNLYMVCRNFTDALVAISAVLLLSHVLGGSLWLFQLRVGWLLGITILLTLLAAWLVTA